MIASADVRELVGREWPRVALGDVARVSSGQGAPKSTDEFSEEGVPFIRAGVLAKLLDGSAESSLELCSNALAKKYKLKKIPKDSVVFAKSGMSAKLGRVYQIKEPCYFVNHLAAVVAGPKLHPNFLTHWLRRHPPSCLIVDDAYPSIRTSEISKLSIPLPPLEEQRRIAAILDKVDAIRRKRAQALAHADAFLRSVFLEMFGDPVEFTRAANAPEFTEYLRDEKTGIQSGPFGSALKKDELVSEGIPVWGIDSVLPDQFIPKRKNFITLKKFEILKRYSVQPGDLLISRAGTVGRICEVPENTPRSIMSTNLVRVRVDSGLCRSSFLSFLFTHFMNRLGDLRTNKKDNAFTFLNPTNLRSSRLALPSVVEQDRFLRFRKRVEMYCGSSRAFEAMAAKASSALSDQLLQ